MVGRKFLFYCGLIFFMPKIYSSMFAYIGAATVCSLSSGLHFSVLLKMTFLGEIENSSEE